ncbi:MAG: hypothetical protein LBI06_08230 [Treponema sp.]|jgi:hypothetical protein|nr:hypothetical protein [Treponema sp.]
MIQLYFLAIVFCGLSGFLFIFGDFTGNSTADDGMRFSSVSSGFRLILGILAGLTGILKLLSPMGIPILGDLVPSLACLAAGFMLIFGFYKEQRSTDSSGEGSVNHFGEIFLAYKRPIGIALLISAGLHFLFPRALFL